MTKEEAIVHIKDIICENNSIKPNIVVFEQEKEALYMAIKALQEQKPIGKWINRIEYGYVECSVCGHLTPCNDKDVVNNLHYCFWCGTKMDGAENDAMDGVWKCSKCVDFKICSKEARVLGKTNGCEDFCLPPDEIDFP